MQEGKHKRESVVDRDLKESTEEAHSENKKQECLEG
jgi:hypothetical protein